MSGLSLGVFLCFQENKFWCFQVSAVGTKSYIQLQDTLWLCTWIRGEQTSAPQREMDRKYLNDLIAPKFSSHGISETGCLYQSYMTAFLGGWFLGLCPALRLEVRRCPPLGSWGWRAQVTNSNPPASQIIVGPEETNTINSSLPEGLIIHWWIVVLHSSTYVTPMSKITSQSAAACATLDFIMVDSM